MHFQTFWILAEEYHSILFVEVQNILDNLTENFENSWCTIAWTISGRVL